MRIEEGVPAFTGTLVEMALDTPALVIDAQKIEQNILGMADVAESRGVVLRPHVKTHKIPSIARWQTEAAAAGILQHGKPSRRGLRAGHGRQHGKSARGSPRDGQIRDS